MNCAVEERINRMQSANTLVQDTKKAMVKNEGGSKLNNDEAKSSITELFPWVSEFRKMCRCIHTDKSMTSLTELMQFYARNVSISINDCYTRPLRASRLKDSISETLLLFMYIYRELSEDRDRSIYLNNMSDLLAMYADMELKASRKSKEDREKICARLTSCLYVYLEHSTEYLLDTLMKIQFMCHSYHHILDPIITKIIKSIPIHPESNLMYVRYLLIYRLWRKINGDTAVKNQITTAAITSLGPPPSAFPPCILQDVLPKVPKCHPNSTKALLQNKFDIRKCCELFIRFCRDTSGSMRQEKHGGASSIDSSNRINSQMPEDVTSKSIERIDNNVNSILTDEIKQSESISLQNTLKSPHLEGQSNFKRLGTFSNNISTNHSTSKSVELNKKVCDIKSKKSKEIVIIDLTSDTEFEKCTKKRKPRKLPWLEEAKKKIDLNIIKASRKIKKKKQRKIGHTQLSEDLNSVNHQSEDTPQFFLQPREIHSSMNGLNACKITDIQNNKNKLIANDEYISSENVRKMNDPKSEIEATITKSHLLDSAFSAKQGANNDGALDTNDDAYANDRLNKPTVIKRLIETDTISEAETCERAESLMKVCDLETECMNAVDSVTVRTQYNSKDDADSSNCSNINVTKDKLIREITTPIVLTEREQSQQSRGMNAMKIKLTESAAMDNDKNQNGIMDFPKILNDVEKSVEQNIARHEENERVRLFPANSMFQSTFELREGTKSAKYCLTNGSENFTNAKKDDSDIQGELEIGNYDEVNDTRREDKSSNSEFRESIFESYSMDKKSISSAFKETICSNENYEKNCGITCIDKSDTNSVENIMNINYQKGSSKHVDAHHNENSAVLNNVQRDLHDSGPPDVLSDVTSKRICSTVNKTTEENSLHNSSGNKYDVQETELQESIDGLSLLASVSQNIPHLKAGFQEKSDQIKVKDYASLRYASCNQVTDDEADTNDSSNTVSQLLQNPSTDIINRIVGIYPEDALDKVALHVEVTSIEANPDNSNNGIFNMEPHREVNINYETDILSHNTTTMESNVHPTKENTNVILNGETVVLLQKSPNSNLYIINKAVENLKNLNNDDEISKLKDKSWLSPPEECGQFEILSSSDQTAFNLELAQYNKEPLYQEVKFAIDRNKGVKLEPEDNNLTNISDTKSYSKKISLPTDILPVSSQMYQDVTAMNVGMNMSVDKRKSSKSNMTFRQSIKQEFNAISNHIASNCGTQGCNGIHSHPHEVDAQHPLHIPATRPTTLPSIYGNCAGGTDLCVPYHKHCTSVSCSLQINSTTSLHSHTKSSSPCGRSHCSCLNCTYDIVTHCRQCIHPPTDTHVSCIESNPYFLPTHSSVQTPAVQEHDRTKSEAVIGKLYDDQLLCKIEKNRMQNTSLEKIDVQRDTEKLFKKDMDNKLPLKKRLKAHAMMTTVYNQMPIKTERLNNYPAIPMMSIAALEALDNTQKRSAQIVKSEYELPSTKKDDQRGSYHFNSNLVRRDYYKDIQVSNSHHSLGKESARKHERQFRSGNDQSSSAVCQESCLQRTFKAPAQCKETNVSGSTPLKRFGAESMGQEVPYKKAKKAQSSRQTRSSKRNVPKVNYCYTDVDPEWNPSGEAKRKRKKASR